MGNGRSDAPASQRSAIHDDEVTASETMLGRVLEASHTLPPDQLATLVTREAERAGMVDLVMYLVDLDQRLLVPVRGSSLGAESDVLDIDATVAGRAFRLETMIDVEAGDGSARRRVWVPLLDGAERLGVLGITTEPLNDQASRRCRHLATLVSELLVCKVQYGDTLVTTRRRRRMELSAELRWSSLPPLTFTSPRVAIAGVLEPTYQVAGDAFDYALNGDIAHVAIFDAMGHGLEASRMSNLAVAGYRHSRRGGLDLRATFAAVDRVLADQFGDERFVTAVMATLDCLTGELAWLSAGHPQPLVLRGKRMIGELATDPCLPLGLAGPIGQPAITVLEPGDVVLLYTDGVVEARSRDGDPFGQARLVDLLVRAAADRQTPSETMRRLVHAVLQHQDAALEDDATLLMLEWRRPA